MVNEIKYSDYVNTGSLQTHVTLLEFLRLFLNHRPTAGEEIGQLKKLFKMIGEEEEQEELPSIGRQRFIDFLKYKGEAFKEKDFVEYVAPLFGYKREEEGLFDNRDKRKVDDDGQDFYNIPKIITYEEFVKDALKFPESVKSNLVTSDVSVEIPFEAVIDEAGPPIQV